jgi:hypothetical protein
MPLSYEIDHARKIIFTRASGILTPQDMFAYQKDVWGKHSLRSFHECVDMNDVTEIVGATEENMLSLASLAVQSDDPVHPTRLAIIARENLHFGLGRMYEAHRSMLPGQTRQVAIFRSRADALRWLVEDRQNE